MAEREGFEPSIRETRIPDFESGAFDHSATSPMCRTVCVREYSSRTASFEPTSRRVRSHRQRERVRGDEPLLTCYIERCN